MNSKYIFIIAIYLFLAHPVYGKETSNSDFVTSQYGGKLKKTNGFNPNGSNKLQGIIPSSYQHGSYQRESLPSSQYAYREQERQRRSLSGLPAWAQQSYHPAIRQELEPFGANLFRGNFASTYSSGINNGYYILPGDRIIVRVWGAKNYDDILFVDQQGNIFLPEVGPIKVTGLRQSQLLAAVKAKLVEIFPENVNIYVDLQSSQPVAIYVAGNVFNPGRYAGGPQDSVMSYLDRAGGILPEQGSYRKIKILRNKKVIGKVDLYNYITRGELPTIRLKDGDTILVESFGTSISAYGLVRQAARYEFFKEANGKELLSYALPINGASHVSISGIRNKKPFNVYLSFEDFYNFHLEDDDSIEFIADTRANTIMVSVSGAIQGASRFPIIKQTRLKALLEHIAIEPDLADIDSIYIRRKSVAAEQKAILTDTLRRLEQSALTATSASVDEASIRVKEAELIQNFVQRASKLQPDGVLVVSRSGKISDVLLEDGDEVIIPRRTDVVHVSGEVLIPTAVTWDKKLKLKEYLNGSGGLSDRADVNNILIVGLNGEVFHARAHTIKPGDRILVMPKFDSKNLQLVKDITQVLYQMAVAVKVAVGL